MLRSSQEQMRAAPLALLIVDDDYSAPLAGVPQMVSISAAFLIIGGAVFGILGALHTLYTLLDLRNPRRLAPREPEVVEAMRAAKVRISRGGTDMWRAWIGFNLSHSLGLLVFATLAVASGAQRRIPTAELFAMLVIVGTAYVVLAARYWFRIPLTGAALGTACFLLAWLTS
jgi:hypothetical protein